MAHPRMYDDADPLLAKTRPICLALPETREVEAWGRPTFRAGKKIFAVYSSDDQHDHALVFKPEADDREALAQDSRIYVPAYFGPAGWLALDLDVAPPDWQEIAELVEGSYRQVALKRMLRTLDNGPLL